MSKVQGQDTMIIEGYIRFMNHYLKHGDWISDVYGENQEKRIKW